MALLKISHLLHIQIFIGLHFGVVWVYGAVAIARIKLDTPRKNNYLPFLPHFQHQKQSKFCVAHILAPLPTPRVQVRSGFTLQLWYTVLEGLPLTLLFLLSTFLSSLSLASVYSKQLIMKSYQLKSNSPKLRLKSAKVNKAHIPWSHN